MEEQFDIIKKAVIERKIKEIAGFVKEALDKGIDPNDIINEGLIPAMDEVGNRFAEGAIFVPEMLVSARTMSVGLDVVKPLLTGDKAKSRGTIILGTVKGDLHDIGKNIVAIMLEGAGFKVLDLGVNLSVDKLIEEIKKNSPDIIGLSALLTTTLPEMQTVIEELKKQGLRDKVKVMIGGAPVDAKFAEKIGADAYGKDAAEAVMTARRLLSA